MVTRDRILATVDRLIVEGQRVAGTKRHAQGHSDIVDPELFAKWLPGCRNVMHLLGDFSRSFGEPFTDSADYYEFTRCRTMLGSLMSLRESLVDGLLISINEIVFAEAFADLIEQAEDLTNKGYFLAAGVICRAVFEEHLRKLCDVHDCLPTGRPTIETLKQSLAKASVLNALDVKNTDAIAGEGNYCAHNKQPPLGENEIRGLIQKVQNFLIQHPLR